MYGGAFDVHAELTVHSVTAAGVTQPEPEASTRLPRKAVFLHGPQPEVLEGRITPIFGFPEHANTCLDNPQEVRGNIAVARRGGTAPQWYQGQPPSRGPPWPEVPSVVKAMHAQNAGAVALILVDTDEEETIMPGCTDICANHSIMDEESGLLVRFESNIPVLRVANGVGDLLRAGAKVTIRRDATERDILRPKYGNVNVLAHLKGDRKAAQYGKSYLVLRPGVRARCTITSADSSRPHAVLGTLQHCAHVLYKMLEVCPDDARRRHLVETFLTLATPTEEDANDAIERRVTALREMELNWDYMEVQIHGTLRFDRDVSMVVVHETDVHEGRDQDCHGLWREFAAKFNVPCFKMTANAMVPLG